MNTPRVVIIICGVITVGLIGSSLLPEKVEESPLLAENRPGAASVIGATAGASPAAGVDYIGAVIPATPGEVQQARYVEQKEAKSQIMAMAIQLEGIAARSRMVDETQRRWQELRLVNEWKWTELVRTNRGLFNKLKSIALTRKSGKKGCEICHRSGWLDSCIICSGTGACPTCKGKGIDPFSRKPCATCEGRKSCFICAGTRKMDCPFCEDGKVAVTAELPPREMPLP